MPKRLDAAARERRLRLDEHAMALINTDRAPIRVTGHRSGDDARSGANPIAPASGAAPEHYRVVYDFDTLVSLGVRETPTIVHMDLMANGNYPFTEPVCRTVGKVKPWTPHFSGGLPICLGAGWPSQSARGAGETLAADLVVHIAKLLNFDEPEPRPGYHGYNAAAIDWWRTKNHYRPLNPDLVYPNVTRFDPNAGGGVTRKRFGVAKPPSGPDTRRFAAATVPVPTAGRFTRAGGGAP